MDDEADTPLRHWQAGRVLDTIEHGFRGESMMATTFDTIRDANARDRAFFLAMALAIAACVVGGFGLQFLAGRSHLASPWWVHLHGMTFMAWIILYVTQNVLIYRQSFAYHRQLGWAGAVLMVLMSPVGLFGAAMSLHTGRTPPFFAPDFFLALSTMEIVGFVGLTSAAIMLRARTQWHRRLMLSGTILVSGPAWGRLLPMPLLGKWGEPSVCAVLAIFVLVAMGYDVATRGRVHPAYLVGLGTIAGTLALMTPLAASPPYQALVAALTG